MRKRREKEDAGHGKNERTERLNAEKHGAEQRDREELPDVPEAQGRVSRRQVGHVGGGEHESETSVSQSVSRSVGRSVIRSTQSVNEDV